MILYRPIGLFEFRLLEEANFIAFPPRLYWQPIFYPVKTIEYARKIAKEWNTEDKASGYIGYVTCFEVDDTFISNYDEHIVGNNECIEYWIPSEELDLFNNNILNKIQIVETYRGEKFEDNAQMEEVWKDENYAKKK